MITVPTVLVLGAGASAPYGFPSGSGLRDNIIGTLNSPESASFKQLREMSASVSLLANFGEALSYSGMSSVDAFLEHRREFIEVGKVAIAQALIPLEVETNLFYAERRWYQYVFERMSTTFDEFQDNKVSVLTFNYDRSLEHFLVTAIRHKFGKSESESASKVRKLKIIHLHGQLGLLPWQGGDGRPYGIATDNRFLEDAAQQIKIVSEDMSEAPQFAVAHEILGSAEKVLFLGFGYNPTNLKRLLPDQLPQCKFFGSRLDITDVEAQPIRRLMPSIMLGNPSQDVLSLLRGDVPID
jgi:hypothetical protein